MPREVFELDKDERWQARLEEARARREVALREKAAGKSQKKRLKPWEEEGAEAEAPDIIEPIIQERGDDKFDFADRLEAIREAKEAEAAKAKAEKPVGTKKPIVPEPPPYVPDPPVPDVPEPAPTEPDLPEPDLPDPPPPPPFAQPLAMDPVEKRSPRQPVRRAVDTLPPKEVVFDDVPDDMPPPPRRQRPSPSLVLPGAPDVAELAARYAETLNPEIGERHQSSVRSVPELLRAPEVAAPKADPRPPKPSRVGIRPLGMAYGLLGLALLPLAQTAPPLEKGPSMPEVGSFTIQPALGVTWSIYQRPAITRSGARLPRTPPPALGLPPFSAPAEVQDGIGIPVLPIVPERGGVEWASVEPVIAGDPMRLLSPRDMPLSAPQLFDGPAGFTTPPQPRAVTNETLPGLGRAPAKPRPPSLQSNQPDARPMGDAQDASLAPRAPQSPLRVTILAPSRADQKLATDIAEDVSRLGHELVRVMQVDYSISNRNVRYFHEKDREAAALMADAYEAELRDFTWFRPQPVEGTTELWLSGRANPVAAPAPRSFQLRTPEVFRPLVPPTVTIRRPGFLGRVIERFGSDPAPASAGRNVSGFSIPEEGN